ncbi:MAG TPA: hypothetical protein PKY47_05860 [Acetomicrobium sp.]|nr:hypothetical protein [Acetomicrobium sp.]HQA36875.1 hypothetical protein [Acetomicrobium sp.]HQC87835.1 hypothetical protein [Acetomicrobium sp.]
MRFLVEAMAFDKTGTLVKAKPLVADLASLSEIAGRQITANGSAILW